MSFSDIDGNELIGYTDRWSAPPGQEIRLHASSTYSEAQIDVVRLLHGDPNPAGPGLRMEEVASKVDGTYPMSHNRLQAGSYAVCSPEFAGPPSRLMSVWLWTLKPSSGRRQTIFCRGDVRLYLDENGVPTAQIGTALVAAAIPLQRARWHRVAVAISPQPELAVDDISIALDDPTEVTADGVVTLAAFRDADGLAAEHFNGRLEDLRLDDRHFDVRDLELVNGPTLAVTGRLWDDDTTDFRANPDQYAAVHFHDDDIDDAQWPVTLALTVPDQFRSGIYAFRMQAGGLVDHVPFVVIPRPGTEVAPIALLLPTLTYQVYANERMIDGGDGSMLPMGEAPRQRLADRWLADHPDAGASAYDRHSDGTGICLVSMHRPIPNVRPDYVWWNTDSPERFSSDLYIADFLSHRGQAWDALTDHDLHEQGVGLLDQYPVVVTGTHPEYCSREMLVAIEAYLQGGGRLLYLGGNGFYWVTSIDPQRPHLAEVRRGLNGTRAWTSRPGELRHQTTGQLGGLWRYRDRSPNKLVGVGFAAQADTISPGSGYERTAASFQDEYKWIFSGVSGADVIGDYGLYVGGAAGYEIDRHDPALGSPVESAVLMTSQGRHSKDYLLTIEDMDVTLANANGVNNDNVRADVVLRPYPGGGAVFSVGSCSWAGSLSHNDYDNDIYRITDNVLNGFLTERSDQR